MIRRFQQQHLAQLTNYRWLKYASLLWSMRIACIAIAVCIPLISQLLLIYSDSSHISVSPSLQLPVYDVSNFTRLSTNHPFIVRGITLPPSVHRRLFEVIPSLVSPVKSSSEPYFQYFAADKVWSFDALPHNTSTMFFSDFMRRCYGYKSPLLLQQHQDEMDDNFYYYYSHAAPQHVTSLLPDVLLPNVSPETRLWFSSTNAVVQPHYDMEHNYFLQLTGSKSFLLASPEHYSVYAPYSYLHSQWRQAQNKYILRRDDVIAMGVRAGLYNSTAHAGGVYNVTLQAGDMLYIPAFYFHTVFTHADSISLNAWVGSTAFDISRKLPRVAAPFQSTDSTRKKLASIFVVFKILCTRLLLDIRVVHRDLMQRYEGICAGGCRSSDESECKIDEIVDKNEIQLALTSKIAKRGIEAAAGSLSQVSPAIRTLLLLDYIEQLMEFAIEKDDLVPCKMLGIVAAWDRHI